MKRNITEQMSRIKTLMSINEEMKSDVVDIEKLRRYAESIAICCAGEYGMTWFKPAENHIFVCIGDSSPFDYESLEWYMKEAVAKNGYDSESIIKVTVENEAEPDGEGWIRIK